MKEKEFEIVTEAMAKSTEETDNGKLLMKLKAKRNNRS